MKNVLITGASRGIGWQTAWELCPRGYRVYLGTRDAELNGNTVQDVEGEAIWITIDVSDSEGILQ